MLYPLQSKQSAIKAKRAFEGIKGLQFKSYSTIKAEAHVKERVKLKSSLIQRYLPWEHLKAIGSYNKMFSGTVCYFPVLIVPDS